MTSASPLPKANFEVETLTLVILYQGPQASDYAGPRLERLLQEHLAFTVDLVGQGHLLSAGGVVDPDTTMRITGIGFSIKPPDEVLELVRQDPSIKAGLEAVKTATYTFPKGALAFPMAHRTARIRRQNREQGAPRGECA